MHDPHWGPRALVVAAHPDDEVLGCGGTMARLADAGVEVHTLILATGHASRDDASPTDALALAALQAAAHAAGNALGTASVTLCGLPDNQLDAVPLLTVVKHVEATLRRVQPTVVFTHLANDVNIDHAIVHRAVLAATRPQPGVCVRDVYYFEIASSSEWGAQTPGWTFRPTLGVDVTATLDRKLEAMACYAAELRDWPHPRSLRGLRALAELRGTWMGVAAAEAFEVGRILR
jgi:LmbE family N-acetylglucosaminyl deacetylase